MSWHYQLRQRSDKGETWCDIVEVYENPRGSTYDGIAPISDTPEGMIRTLQNMIDDIRAYPVILEHEEI